MSLTSDLLTAQKLHERNPDGLALGLLYAAQKAYDANVPNSPLPERPMTSKESRDLDREILIVLETHLNTQQCKVGQCWSKPCCEIGMKFHNACFTDPRCVDHG